MRHYILRNQQQANGGFTDLFVLGTQHAYNATTRSWGSDFTAAAATQSYNLLGLTDANSKLLYIVHYPLAYIFVKGAFTNDANNPKLDLGTTAGATLVIAGAAGDLEVAGKALVPVTAAAPIVASGASQFLTCLLTSAVANVSALAGTAEIWIYACLVPMDDSVNLRQA